LMLSIVKTVERELPTEVLVYQSISLDYC